MDEEEAVVAEVVDAEVVVVVGLLDAMDADDDGEASRSGSRSSASP